MRILINDFEDQKERYMSTFSQFGYEKNELIFCDSFDKSKAVIVNHLAGKKLHIDLIITNESPYSPDTLMASELSYLKNKITESFSRNNFRICSIPIILYSNYESKSDSYNRRFDSIVQISEVGNHDYFISECERVIREWRHQIYADLDNLGINISHLPGFQHSNYFMNYYQSNISKKAEEYFSLKTKVLSIEFIRLPAPLHYDWIILNDGSIEKAILDFEKTYKNHIKYDRYNNERTILHDFFDKNRLILLRDTYTDLQHEKNLFDLNEKTSEECDYILKTEFPDFLKTTFFEVKKEDVVFYVKKHTKRPQLSRNFFSHLEQVWRYKEFTQDTINQPEITNRIGYETNQFDYVLLAGRLEEKMEFKEKFDKDLNRMFKDIEVITYEELEEININYLDRFNRLK
jgi:hypothetical protein